MDSLEEAITCHASQCFTAAAMLVRKTLELLCSAQNVSGAKLKDRIKDLGRKWYYLPTYSVGSTISGYWGTTPRTSNLRRMQG
jgi:hypothetical protein